MSRLVWAWEVLARSVGGDSEQLELLQFRRPNRLHQGLLLRPRKTYASLSTKRAGKTVSLTSKTKVYNPEKYGKVNYNPKVKFQVKSGGKWKTIKTVTANKGKATYKVKTKSKKSYRVTFSQVSWATGATSKSAKR